MGEPAVLSGLGSSTGAGRGTGTSLGCGDTEEMVAGCSSSSSSSSEDSDEDDDEEDDEDEEDEELDELPLSESEVLSFSPSESAYREHLEDESLPSSSPGNPEGAIRRDGWIPAWLSHCLTAVAMLGSVLGAGELRPQGAG